ncbi:MAG: hypothetical protein INH41_10790 [Myxococcaceae bacterium]|jgi:hypothetical protein|nr:hypothetical protein [Myxococcaceae bacterium]MCA3012872.1 hypothetical protein [Myxococcaceae bacterium]
MVKLNNSLNNVIQGAVLRTQISAAKADGRVTSQEMASLLQRARAGGVMPSELSQLRQLAAEARNNSNFDAAGKAQLNKFLGNNADRSHASGRLPPAANLPQKNGIFGGVFDRVRLNSLEQHFKKDDGMIGRSEGRAILKNIFKDGDVSASERQFLQKLLKDPNVSAAAKQDISLILSLRPGVRLVDGEPVPMPRMPRELPTVPTNPGSSAPPSPGTTPATTTTASTGTPTPPVVIPGSTVTTTTNPGQTVPTAVSGVPASGTSGTSATDATGWGIPTGDLNYGNHTDGKAKWDGRGMPDPRRFNMQDPQDAANFQRAMASYQQAMNNINLFFSTLSTVLKAQNDTASGISRNIR